MADVKIPKAEDLVWEWCDHCGTYFTRCPMCSGNSCAGGCFQQTDTEPCPMKVWWEVVVDAEQRGLTPQSKDEDKQEAMNWHDFTTLPPVGPTLLIRTDNPLSTVRCYREGDTLYDWSGNSICEVNNAKADLRGWLWAVLEEA